MIAKLRRTRANILVATVLVPALLASAVSTAVAAPVDYNISWRAENWNFLSPDNINGCAGNLASQGTQWLPLSPEWTEEYPWSSSFFAVNGVRLVTIDKSLGQAGVADEDDWHNGHVVGGTGGIYWSNTYDTRFSGALLEASADNKIDFDSYGALFNSVPPLPYPETTSWSNINSLIYLESSTIGRRLLFQEFRCGWYQRKTFTVPITLAELDPMLAGVLEDLLMAIGMARDTLLTNARNVDNVPAKLQELDDLKQQLSALFDRGLENITLDDLNDLFDRFLDVLPDGFRTHIAGLFESLKESIGELHQTLADEVERLRHAAAATSNTVLSGAAAAGFDPAAPSTFAFPNDIPAPSVQLPPISGGGEWHPDQDPYKAYADQVLDRLHGTIQGGIVVYRAQFMDIVQEWEHVEDLLERGLNVKADLTPEEYLAFAKQRQRVAEFVHTQMDEENWFRDTPVPQEARDLYDVLVALHFYDQAKRLHRNLNEWRGTLTPEQGAIVQIMAFLAASIRELKSAKDQPAQSKLLAVVSVIIELAKIGVQFTPVGDVLAVCEAVTGWSDCNPNGRRLSIVERVIAGSGFFIAGTVAAWKHVAARLAEGETKATVGWMAGLLERFRGRAKTRLPKTEGRWLNEAGEVGERGESLWHSTKAEVIAITGGEGVPFKFGHPQFGKWQVGEPFVFEGAEALNGTREDFKKVYVKVMEREGLSSPTAAKNWLKQKKLTPHHVEDGKTIQLIPTALHKNVSHIGGASMLRDANQILHEEPFEDDLD